MKRTPLLYMSIKLAPVIQVGLILIACLPSAFEY